MMNDEFEDLDTSHSTKCPIMGYASIGHNARGSDWKMTNEQTIYVDKALQDLKKQIDKIFPGWKIINIEVKE